MSHRPDPSPMLRAIPALCGTVILFVSATAMAAESAVALPGTHIARIVIGSLVVIGLLFATVRLLPRLSGAGAVESSSFRVVASLAVGQRERVVVVQVGNEQILLGVAPGHVDRLHELAEPLVERERSGVRSGLPAQPWVDRILGRRA